MPRTRLELAQPFDHYHLKVACIPISPPGQKFKISAVSYKQKPLLSKQSCARNRTRTYTAVKPLVPETSVYTNFTTWASTRCPTRIRTWTDRTKTCCAAITQWDNLFCFERCKSKTFSFSNKKKRQNSIKIIIFVLCKLR